jgi:hypothetical protein
MFLVELVMNRLQPVQQKHVARAGALAASGSRRGRRVLLHRELEKLPLRHSAQRTRNPGIEETNDGLENPVRSVRIAPMNAEDTPVEAEHHRAVGMGDNSIDISETQLMEPDRELILE